ncbi:MAG: FAD:protein FMN transferase [Deltaproteobacteria bacterium]|nr:FAD:protein FMN transferase [Deltaproteobacteria bacterium]
MITPPDKPALWPRVVLPALVVIGVGTAFLTRDKNADIRLVRHAYPQRIMGTSCHLTAVESRHLGTPRAPDALRHAEAALRSVETQMSSWIHSSELSRFNAAAVKTKMPLSASTLYVLRAGRALFRDSDGAFDITCRPLIELWKRAGKSSALPSEADRQTARDASRWRDILISDDGAEKRRATARVDLGGIAKGYAIDRAIDALRKGGVIGGLVDIGGDLRVFGKSPRGSHWEVEIRDPFRSTARNAPPAILATLLIKAASVCTSGNYARFVTIAGKHYSHIIDPRSGRPTQISPSVTVFGPDAMHTDAWATALSVLGEAGLSRLPRDFEALLILGDRAHPKAVATKGFPGRLKRPFPHPLRLVQRRTNGS